MRNLILSIVLVAAFLCLTLSCNDNSIEPMIGGPGIIVPGVGIEGIKLGDSKETVEARLGTPTSKGWADGAYRGWRDYAYMEGALAGLDIFFIDNGSSYGPVDEILVGGPYRGSTKQGIHIGSSRSDLQHIYGPPESSLADSANPGWAADFYCINGKKWEVHYQDSILTGMSIGYYIPIPQDRTNPCR